MRAPLLQLMRSYDKQRVVKNWAPWARGLTNEFNFNFLDKNVLTAMAAMWPLRSKCAKRRSNY